MITENIQKILNELPKNVALVAATKSRNTEEILEAISAGIKTIGENYVQEAEMKFATIGNKVKWHLIGHLQTNKAKKAVKIFDCIETVDSFELAKTIDKECVKINKIMPIMIEINIASEPQKNGCLPQNVEALAKQIIELKNLELIGLMTMGSIDVDDNQLREQFHQAHGLYDKINSVLNGKLQYLSMGMSSSYKLAIEAGANMVRVGTLIFGERKK